MYPKKQVLFARARAPDLGYVLSIALVSTQMSNVSKFVAVATFLGRCVKDRTNRMVPGNLR